MQPLEDNQGGYPPPKVQRAPPAQVLHLGSGPATLPHG